MRELPAEMVLPEGMVPDEPPVTPVVPRDAATVVLIRDTTTGPEVFLQRRVTGMAFAGGMTVFPGGGVDRRDADASIAWAGPEPAWWGRCFDCDPALATALVCAAVRETFEESGVLLAGPDATSVVADTRPYAAARKALEEREVSLAQFLTDAGLVLRADLLRPWAHWVTPIEEPRRYDTRFFVAVLPEGQRADDVTSEASDALWQAPAAAIADWREGRRGLMPPTWTTLADLDEFDSTAAVMAADRTVEKIIPRVVRRGGKLHVVLPGDPGVPDRRIRQRGGTTMSRFPAIGEHAQHPAYGVLRKVTPIASVMLADNPSIMTLDGTNTWLLRAPDSVSCVVVDPGPLDEAHLTRIAACGPVATVVITHGHPDHAEGARRFAELAGAPTRAINPTLCHNADPLADDDVIAAAGLRLRVLATPGHTADSLCLLLDHEGHKAVLTGDSVLGRGTTVVAHPDGKLADYLNSLHRLADLPPGTLALPGHGPELPDAAEAARRYLTHREQRLAQVRTAVDELGGTPTARQVVEVVYADVDRSLWAAAEWSVEAQLEYLRTEN